MVLGSFRNESRGMISVGVYNQLINDHDVALLIRNASRVCRRPDEAIEWSLHTEDRIVRLDGRSCGGCVAFNDVGWVGVKHARERHSIVPRIHHAGDTAHGNERPTYHEIDVLRLLSIRILSQRTLHRRLILFGTCMCGGILATLFVGAARLLLRRRWRRRYLVAIRRGRFA